jgi:hypothetical protein
VTAAAHPGDERGQATVELLALVPLVVAAALAATAILAHLGAGERAGEAARAGAMALLQDEDPRVAARAALPSAERAAARIAITGRRVTVTLPSRGLRTLIPALTARAGADAGPDTPR